MRFSHSRRIRTGGQSGLGSSLDIMAGSQYWRMRLPIGVPGPTFVISSLSSLVSMERPFAMQMRRAGRVRPALVSELGQSRDPDLLWYEGPLLVASGLDAVDAVRQDGAGGAHAVQRR